MGKIEIVCSILVFIVVGIPAYAEQCGHQVGGAVCPGGLCCSKDGWCGTSIAYCGAGCQSQCGGEPTPPPPPPPPPAPPTPTPPPSGEGVASIITESVFNEMFKHRTEGSCVGKFYVYDAFITAAKAFDGFGTTGDAALQKKELAAFFGQTSQETSGWWATATEPYAWGYCYLRELNPPDDYCTSSEQYPCAPGQKYYGRGPMQISHNYNYIPAGKAIGFDGLNDPDIVATDPVISFKTAIWFWMTPQYQKPSCHDVITGKWTPSADDKSAGRVAGYGLLTNIINGGVECGKGFIVQAETNRIGYYKRYCGMLGVSDEENLSCENQKHYGLALSMSTEEAQIIKTVVE